MDGAPAPEFARPVDIARLAREEQVFEISATYGERAALARRFALLALDRLEAHVGLRRVAGGLVRLSAELSADVVQECVVTLDPLPRRIEERFTLLYGAVEESDEVVLDSAAETVEGLEGDVIDIGEAVAQQLSLVLDPYPRAPDAAFVEPPAEGEPAASPFAVLADRVKRR